jgi:hypothetical protein
VHCSQPDEVDRYKSDLAENIFACMELSRQAYPDIMLMPVKRFQDYLKWKSKLEDEKQKRFEEDAKKHG